MKIFLKSLFVTLLSFALGLHVQAQQTTIIGKRAQTIFLEIAGPGLISSINYDTRFNHKRDGLGGRAGLGFFAYDGDALFTVPVQLNYLTGNKSDFLETGVGLTYALLTNLHGKGVILNYGAAGAIAGSFTLGYRYQPIAGGFNFRIAFTPFFSTQGLYPYGGLSFGYTFK